MADAVPDTTGTNINALTDYLVLAKDESGYWKEHKLVAARSAEHAIRAALDGKPAVALTVYVAVPQRSWKPVKVRAEQTVTLKFEDA